jgi:hypothetical protein
VFSIQSVLSLQGREPFEQLLDIGIACRFRRPLTRFLEARRVPTSESGSPLPRRSKEPRATDATLAAQLGERVTSSADDRAEHETPQLVGLRVESLPLCLDLLGQSFDPAPLTSVRRGRSPVPVRLFLDRELLVVPLGSFEESAGLLERIVVHLVRDFELVAPDRLRRLGLGEKRIDEGLPSVFGFPLPVSLGESRAVRLQRPPISQRNVASGGT